MNNYLFQYEWYKLFQQPLLLPHLYLQDHPAGNMNQGIDHESHYWQSILQHVLLNRCHQCCHRCHHVLQCYPCDHLIGQRLFMKVLTGMVLPVKNAKRFQIVNRNSIACKEC